MHFKTQDLVVVTAGAHREKQGRVLRVDEENDQVYIQGVNLRYKHIRRSQKNPRGGRVQKEAPIHVSNVSLVDPKTNRPTRVGFRVEGGKKVRYAKRSGETIKDPTGK
ncbi:MAG: 50S ribosomal protein L24 [Planctomycetota bacterium]